MAGHGSISLATMVLTAALLGACARVTSESGTASSPDAGSPCGIRCENLGPAHICDPATAQCVECFEDKDCSFHFPGGVCLLPEHICGCRSDQECAMSTQGTRCDITTQRCGCRQASDCTQGINRPACAPELLKCGCGADVDCPSAALPHCYAPIGLCVSCLSDADCADPNNPVCLVAEHICRQCLVDADCTTSAFGPHCQAHFCDCTADVECVGRAAGSRCLPPYAGADNQVCSCAVDQDCPQGTTCDVARNRCLPPGK